MGESGDIGYIKMRNDFTGEIVDLNRKIKEIVEEEVKWKKERVLLGRKRKYEEGEENDEGEYSGEVNNKPKAQDKEKQRTHNTRNVNKIHNKVNDNDDNIIITRKDDNDGKCSQEEQILQIEHKEIQNNIKEDTNNNINITQPLNDQPNNNDNVEDDDDDDLVIPDIN